MIREFNQTPTWLDNSNRQTASVSACKVRCCLNSNYDVVKWIHIVFVSFFCCCFCALNCLSQQYFNHCSLPNDWKYARVNWPIKFLYSNLFCWNFNYTFLIFLFTRVYSLKNCVKIVRPTTPSLKVCCFFWRPNYTHYNPSPQVYA